jgi:hypothetical protein
MRRPQPQPLPETIQKIILISRIYKPGAFLAPGFFMLPAMFARRRLHKPPQTDTLVENESGIWIHVQVEVTE